MAHLKYAVCFLLEFVRAYYTASMTPPIQCAYKAINAASNLAYILPHGCS